ncbi:MAG: hypothetical protein HFJ55_06895 [Clostridia bacterium]|nr:hypothetical protein [Clostridia bacterium]
MEKTFFKRIIALLTVIVIMAADFVILGTNLISYATTFDSLTNNPNVEFSAYFKTEEGTRVDNISKSIKSNGMKLYAEIKVNKEGYFNGSIELQESNFKLKSNVLSDRIASIEGNKINLKQINAGETVEIEVDIEPIVEDKIAVDMMSKESTINLAGQYMETTYKGIDIKAIKTVKANFEVDAEAQAEIETEIITNQVLPIKGENKRIVQLMVKSNMQGNQYPIKQTNIDVEIPALSGKEPEEIKVLSLGTKATNGKESTVIESFDKENGKLLLTLKNEPNEENKIEWNKKEKDELIITFIYDEMVEANAISVTTNTEIELYNAEEKKTATDTKTIENQTVNKTITTQIERDSEEIYKGQLYVNAKTEANTEVNYKTNTKINITNSDIVDNIVVNEGPDMYVTQELAEIEANTRFVSTEINKEKMLSLLGQDGTIQINDGTKTIEISKDTEANENGNIVINHVENVNRLEITLSKPEKAGVLEISHNKAIVKSSYTIEQLKTISGLALTSTIKGKLEDKQIVENTTKSTVELKETKTKAELTVSKESLSTVSAENEVILGVKLITNGTQYDLYKNPKITIQLPDTVEEVTANGAVSKLYDNEFKVRAIYNKETRIMEITLEGEQTTYPTDEALQAYLQFNLNLKLRKLAPSKVDKIVMTYTNENATQYEGGTTEAGIVEKAINITSPSGLIPVNTLETYKIEGIAGISANKQVANIDRNTAGGTDLTYKMELANNTGNDVKNVKILGTIPAKGTIKVGADDIENTLETTLKAINAEGATIYYSNNINATADLNDTNNGWNSNLAEVANAKAYLIVVENIAKDGRYNATYTVTLPQELEYDQTSYAGYKVFFNEGENTIEQKEESTLIGISTGEESNNGERVSAGSSPVEGINIETSLTAKVGMDEIKNGDTVKAGEVIRYTVRIKNTGSTPYTNVIAKASIPEGTVYVEPDKGNATMDDLFDENGNPIENDEDLNFGYVYSGDSYYIEKPEIKEVTKTITTLEPNKEYIFSYEARVNMDITEGTQTSNKATIVCNNKTIESNEISTKLETAKIRATLKSTTPENVDRVPNLDVEYYFFIENLSEETVKDLKVEVMTEGLKIWKTLGETIEIVEDFKEDKIENIEGKGIYGKTLVAKINEDAKQIPVAVKITDKDGNVYRSNVFSNNIIGEGAKISLTTPNNGGYVSIGDEIRYNFAIENIGGRQSAVDIIDNISEYLEIVGIEVNGKTELQTLDRTDKDTYKSSISNNLRYTVPVQQGEKVNVTIVTKVKQSDNMFDVKTITNSAKVSIGGNVYDTSGEVTHFIKGNYLESDKSIVSGVAWLDANTNGQRDLEEQTLSGIKVLLYNTMTNSIATDKDGNRAETTTNENGEYTFRRMESGQYIVLFEFDTTKYELTDYKKEGVQESQNSKAILKSIVVDGQEKLYGVTDIINLAEIATNINMGLKDNYTYDLELHKYISRIVVQNDKGTKSYDYSGKDSTFQKIEINRKQLNNSTVILEYTIRVKNTGAIAGNVNSIVDYLPKEMNFNSELNPDWYLSGESLHTKSLANDKIQPGETREIKLVLTKAMTENSTGLVNNRAEIEESFNDLGKADIDSVENNQVKGEDDMGSADVIISVSTGGKTISYAIMIIINTILIGFAIYLIFKREIREKLMERRK